MNQTGGMQTCPRCGGALFPPGSVVGWGGPICRCGTQYDLQKGPQVPQIGTITIERNDQLDRIEEKLDKLLKEKK